MKHINYYKHIVLVSLFIFKFALPLTSQPLPYHLQKIVLKAFQKKETTKIIASLEEQIKKQKLASDKVKLYCVLADYEERNEFFLQSATHYCEAAYICEPKEKKALFIKALSAFLLADDMIKASQLCYDILLTMVDEPYGEDDIKLLVFFEWFKLKFDEDISFENIRKYSTDVRFEKYHPALFLTLWWVENDEYSKNILLKKFPNSIESAVIRNEVVLSPKGFWYLMPRESSLVENANLRERKDEVNEPFKSDSEKNYTANTIAKLFQTGFFKTENFAKSLADELRKKGFSVFIKKEQRNFETFFSVLVKSDNKGDIIIRLKSEGYEAVPIFE